MGMALALVRIANAASYLSDKPEVCMNCHVMTDAFASWQRGSHGQVAVCVDCHDPKTMKLRITRPALREASAAMGRDINEATHQGMRSLVCTQCQVEYYFHTDQEAGIKNDLTLPRSKGRNLEEMLDYYDEIDFADYVHPISGVRIVKSQHPDYELHLTGVHSYRDVSCADCHMPYRTEGGAKYTNHHIQSPLLNVSESCAVCHRWSEEEIRDRVEVIQTKVFDAMMAAEDALVRAHLDIAAAVQIDVADVDLAPARKLVRHAQFHWDYVASTNGMGFHSPQESMRLLGEAADLAQQARLQATRLLAAKAVAQAPRYPDLRTREQAWEVVQTSIRGQGGRLLP